MSGLSSWLWGTSQIDDAVDRATSEMLPAGSEDIALNLEICDQIRSKTVPANLAMKALKRRLNHKNPNVQILALGLTDICVKNGGDHFLTEVASREFMDNLVSILKMPALNIDVKNTILRLIQNWSAAFEGKLSLYYVGQVYKTLVNEGFKFPPRDFTAANAAMVDTSTAPEWIDSDVCLRCRTPFTFTNRKHHCRNCGQVFDQQCSSKSLPLPHFGITQEVRVCDGCYNKLTKKAERSDKSHRHSQSVHGTSTTRHRSARDLADEELQRAIQLSLEEARAANGYRPGYVSSQPNPSHWQTSEPPIVDHRTHPSRRAKSLPPEDEDDEDLKAAIEASLREANAPKPSAPAALPTPQTEYPTFQTTPKPRIPNYDLQPTESDAIMRFSQQVEQFQATGARDMIRYPGVKDLYEAADGVRSKLAMSLDDTGKKEQLLTEMHEKMAQIVKMYDGLLSEQIAHSRQQPQQYQPANSVYSMGYTQQPVNGYTQWNQAAAVQYAPQPAPVPEQAQPGSSYLPQHVPWDQTPQALQQQTTGQAQTYQQAAPSGHLQYQTHQQSPEVSQQTGYLHQYHQLQQQPEAASVYQPPSQVEYTQTSFQQMAYPQYQYEQAQPGPSNVPTSTMTPVQSYSTPPVSSYQPQSQQNYSNPPQSSFQPQLQTVASPPPASLPPSALPPVSILPAATTIPQSPPPVIHHSPPAASPTLSRQNTISTYPATTSPPSTSHLARSNTIAYQPPPTQPPQQQQQQQQQAPMMPTFPSVSTLPVFPSVPTAAPQSTQIQPEREALLIDL